MEKLPWIFFGSLIVVALVFFMISKEHEFPFEGSITIDGVEITEIKSIDYVKREQVAEGEDIKYPWAEYSVKINDVILPPIKSGAMIAVEVNEQNSWFMMNYIELCGAFHIVDSEEDFYANMIMNLESLAGVSKIRKEEGNLRYSIEDRETMVGFTRSINYETGNHIPLFSYRLEDILRMGYAFDINEDGITIKPIERSKG